MFSTNPFSTTPFSALEPTLVTLENVTATGVVNSVTFIISSVATAQSPTSIEATSSIGTVVPTITEVLDSVSATAIATEFVENVTEVIGDAAVTATSAVNNVTFIINSTKDLTNNTVSVTTIVETLGVSVVEFPTAITLTTTVENVIEEAVEILSNVTATTTVATNSTITATVFNFQAHADNYSRKRTVYVSRAA